MKEFRIMLVLIFILIVTGVGGAVIRVHEEGAPSVDTPAKEQIPIKKKPADGYGQVGAKKDTLCVRGGCSGELCVKSEEATQVTSVCQWREEYLCYNNASCEIQKDGECGWTQTEELRSCMMRAYPTF